MKITYKRPEGTKYGLFCDMLNQNHLLIAGTTGSGKSVLINGLIVTGLLCTPKKAKFILIDPKRVALAKFKNAPHVLRYASEPDDMVNALEYAMCLTELRYCKMQDAGIEEYKGAHVFVIIDELADLMVTARKRVEPLLCRLCQIARAARVHVIAATQCTLASIIDTTIKVNMDSRVALRTRSAQDSRNVIEMAGCEKLPEYGQAFYRTAKGFWRVDIPMYSKEEIKRIVNHWEQPAEAWMQIAE